MESIQHDVVIVGAGLAGLRAAVECVGKNDVAIVTKVFPTRSHSGTAQGGITASLGNEEEDRWEWHFFDTVKGSDYLADQDAVEIMVRDAPRVIYELEHMGVPFSRTPEGKIAQRNFGGHTRDLGKKPVKRACYAADHTGRVVEDTLYDQCLRHRVRFYSEQYLLSLVFDGDRCSGVVTYDLATGNLSCLRAKAVLLATGGCGKVFRTTSNGFASTGDGFGVAFRAGIPLEDMEFVQFHPTSLYSPTAPQFLLSEAMRGEGALLRNINRKRFMDSYHALAELAPRDVVSRAIISEMIKTGSNHVYLDLTHLEKPFVKNRFPRIHSTCLRYDIDITEDLIPVSPAAHYFMGGVKTDVEGRTSLRGLYAAGEVSCTGVHGANRLASNSLLEGLVYGARTGKTACEATGKPDTSVRYDFRPSAIPDADEIRRTLRKLMWEKAGIIRCSTSLAEAGGQLHSWRPIIRKDYATRHELELKNMLTIAEIIVHAAITRKGSVGAHYRSDYKERGERWQEHLCWDRNSLEMRSLAFLPQGGETCGR